MDSSRFPGKAIKPILQKPLLWHVIERSKKINIPIIVATTNRSIDVPIINVCKQCNVEYFRGSFEDVLDRYYQAAKKYSLENIFRISADTPLIDPRFCFKMVHLLENSSYDYIRFGYNTVGIGMEGFNFKTLESAWKESASSEEREHVTMYIKNHPEKFNLHVIESQYDLGDYHWTVETSYDLEFVDTIFNEFKKEIFYTEDIISLIKRKPYLAKTQ